MKTYTSQLRKMSQLYDITEEKRFSEVAVRKTIPGLEKEMSAQIYKRRKRGGGKKGVYEEFNECTGRALSFLLGLSYLPAAFFLQQSCCPVSGSLRCLQVWNFYYPLP